VAPFITQLLQWQPQAFISSSAAAAAGASAAGRGAGLVRIGQQQETETGALLRRLALDDSACCVVATPSEQGQGGNNVNVVCSQRMGELFVSSEEYAGLLAQTGFAPLFFWPL
jgi:hypothetical protein